VDEEDVAKGTVGRTWLNLIDWVTGRSFNKDLGHDETRDLIETDLFSDCSCGSNV